MKQILVSMAGLIACTAITGCVDDKYDLSDIDTTSKFTVSDLTIPVNMDPFTLSSMFDLDEENPDERVKIIDGVYAIVQNGSFFSSEVSINRIELQGIAGDPVYTTVNTGYSGRIPAGQEISFGISTSPVALSYSSSSVPVEIQKIGGIKGSFRIEFYIDVPELTGKANAVKFSDLVVKFPAGLDAVAETGIYNKADGLLSIPDVKVNGTRLNLALNCTSLDFAKLNGIFDPATHYASISDNISIRSGKITLNGSEVSGSVPSSLSIVAGDRVSDFSVTSFTGEIRYDIKDVNIDDVTLTDLPDILSQPETRITIMNPQIYLKVDNPLHPYSLKARTGMTIVSNFDRNGQHTETVHSLDAPGTFEVGENPVNFYCLSPSKPSAYLSGYSQATHVPFTSLSTVLEGEGIPTSLNISLDNPNVFTQPVIDLPLGRNLGAVEGKYDFYAPLAFGADSKVVYSDTQDGWNDEDVDAITIQTLKVNTTVTSHVPFTLSFTGYPIDVNGNKINGVNIEGATVPAGATDLPIEIKITGEVTHLDGIVFTATGFVPADMQAPLVPENAIDCKNLKATVSGFYIKEL